MRSLELASGKVYQNKCRHWSSWSITQRFHPYPADQPAADPSGRFVFCGTFSEF